MKKTLLLTHEYYPFAGGIASYLHGYFKFIPTVEIITDQQHIEPAAHIHQMKLIGRWWRPRWHLGLRAVKKFVQENKMELLFTPHIFPLGQIALKLKESLGIPYIISLHGYDINLALKKNKKLALTILNQAQHIVVNSNYVKHLLDPYSLPTPITVLTPNAVMPDYPLNTEIVQSYRGKNVILSVGRLVKRKNHEMILRALALLADQDFIYLVVGNGPELSALQTLAYRELGLSQERIRFLPDVRHQDLPSYYQTAQLFVLPTRNLGADIEGYGVVYLEAAYYGLPIIASRDTAAQDFIFDLENGLLVDGTSAQSIADAIKLLLQDKQLRHHLGQAAKTHLQGLKPTVEKVALLKTILN